MKAVKETERKYYKYSPQVYIQPVLTSNIGKGLTVTSTGCTEEKDTYLAFDGNLSTNLKSVRTTQYPTVSMIFDNPVKPDSIVCVNRHTSAEVFGFVGYSVYGIEGENEALLGTSETVTPSDGQEVACALNTIEPYKEIKIVFTCSKLNGYQAAVKEINISGIEYIPQESNESDYDFYKDIDTYKLPKGIARKYYKYQYSDFIQPVLTANGVLDGDSFAIEGANYSTSYTYLAFDGKNNTWWVPLIYKTATITDTHLVMYNPLPLNITNFEITNRTYAGLAPVRGEVFVSDDNINYVSLGTWENDNQTSGGVWNIPLEHDGYYKYYKIQFYEWLYNSAGGRSMAECKITATQREVIDGTESNYDIYKDFDIYYGIGD